MKKIVLLAIVFAVSACAYNPYQQPHFDWSGAPSLVPLEERKPADVGKMCIWGIA